MYNLVLQCITMGNTEKQNQAILVNTLNVMSGDAQAPHSHFHWEMKGNRLLGGICDQRQVWWHLQITAALLQWSPFAG